MLPLIIGFAMSDGYCLGFIMALKNSSILNLSARPLEKYLIRIFVS